MKKQLYQGFASILMILLISFLIVFTTITWRSVSYLNQLAQECSLFQQSYCDVHTTGMLLIELTKSRFDQIMQQLTRTGVELTFSLPLNTKKNAPRAVIKKIGPSQLSAEVTVFHENQRSMKCSCKIIKESHQEAAGLKISYKVVDFICA